MKNTDSSIVIETLLIKWKQAHDTSILEQTFLIEVLHEIQQALKHIPNDCISIIAQAFNLTRAEVYGVATFYDDFKVLTHSPQTEQPVLRLCEAEACQSMGVRELKQQLEARLGDTVIIEPVYCLGNCALAPAAMINDQCLGRVTAEQLITELS